MAKTKLLLIGCGKMGGALLERVASTASVCVVDPAKPPAKLAALPDVTWLASLDKIDPNFAPDIAIIAVKPQGMAAILPAYRKFPQCVFLSIAAGQTFARFASLLGGEGFAIVRAMPNLPASIGQGMAVAVANKNVSSAQRALCDQYLKAVGAVAWIEDESKLDAVTALSGSGPAYVFALAEAMAQAGEILGLPSSLAQQLARETVIGSAGLLAQSAQSAAELRQAVTSPGGTTEAALKSLLDAQGLPELILKAMQAAAKRSKELS